MELNILAKLFTDPNYTKSKNYSMNNNLCNRVDIGNKINNKIFQVVKLPIINLNKTSIKSL